MRSDLMQLYHARDLLRVWTWREIRSRYKQSFLGMAWAILQPLAMMIVYVIVFAVIVKVDTGDIPYPLFAYTALLPWTFIFRAKYCLSRLSWPAWSISFTPAA
jgi:lipopolysaccharide transport system permease protein